MQMQVDELVLAHGGRGSRLSASRDATNLYQLLALVMQFVSGYAFRHTANAMIKKAPSGAGWS